MDVEPGDRAARCRGLMRPTGIEHRSGKGLVVVHACVACGFTRCNRIAEDDLDAVIALMRR